MAKNSEYPLFDRELSWLSFNGRVLQEAADPTVPLYERLKFLAIFSSNLDEFFRVRVGSLRSLMRLKEKHLKGMRHHPKRTLVEINRVVVRQQEGFGRIFRDLQPELAARGVDLLRPDSLSEAQRVFARAWFDENLSDRVATLMLTDEEAAPFLEDRALYLVVDCWAKEGGGDNRCVGMVPIPAGVPRFVEFPEEAGRMPVMFVDDVVRAALDGLFQEHHVLGAYAIKLSRDADLYLEDEFGGTVVEKIRKSLKKRDTGTPTRLLYDLRLPFAILRYLTERFALADEDLVQGGRYHNFNDLFGFPRRGLEADLEPPQPPLARPDLDAFPRLFDAIDDRDRLLHFPYESYDYVTRFLEEGAEDDAVTRMAITLYRVAADSAVSKALIRAAENGKEVFAFVEVKARFDEQSNLDWAHRLEDAGVRVVYSMPDLKVHCKTALITRREGSATRNYAYLGTGNFNEKTARIYTDLGLLTADPRLTDEVALLFDYLAGANDAPKFEHLLVAPFNMREEFERRIAREVDAASSGREAGMLLKMNSLEDARMIRRLYRAAQAGVPITCIVRGICCLIPGRDGLSESIQVRSIVDRYLEHARAYLFENGGEPELFLASADWMKRNLSRRVEVAFPIYDPGLKEEIRHVLSLQLGDNRKARIVDPEQANGYVRNGEEPLRSQEATYHWLESLERSA